jgi:penicillin-binding protein 2
LFATISSREGALPFSIRTQSIAALALVFLSTVPLLAVSPATRKRARSSSSSQVTERFAAAKAVALKPEPAPGVRLAPAARKAAAPRQATAKAAPKIATGPWRVPNYADSTAGDVATGDDPIVRQAAVDALGKLNGSVVVSDAETGRVLTIVNQKLAYKDGFQPCSTVKVPVALAALSESLVDRDTQIRVYGRTSFSMTTALAKSNNQYFASLGEKLGFERMSFYARLYGLGEKASLDIEEEQPGLLPATTPKSGMGMMTSFGDGITLTPLEFAALMGAVANKGTLYYLQYPKNREVADTLIPQVKRHLDIESLVADIKPGMMGAVEYGTARRIGNDLAEPIYGKTGTCTDSRTPTHLGWFGSFTETSRQKLVVVVLLTGGRLVSGPAAAAVAGQVYRNLASENYFARTVPDSPLAASTAASPR